MWQQKSTVRQYPRYAAHAPIVMEAPNDRAQRATQTLDLSQEGAHVCLINEALQVEQPVRVNLHLGAAHGELSCRGTVMWAERGTDGMFHFGVHFEELGAHEQAALRHYLRNKQRKAAPAPVH